MQLRHSWIQPEPELAQLGAVGAVPGCKLEWRVMLYCCVVSLAGALMGREVVVGCCGVPPCQFSHSLCVAMFVVCL